MHSVSFAAKRNTRIHQYVHICVYIYAYRGRICVIRVNVLREHFLRRRAAAPRTVSELASIYHGTHENAIKEKYRSGFDKQTRPLLPCDDQRC